MRIVRVLLRCYPRAWRNRYGDELEALVLESSGGRRPSLRVALDLAVAGARERLHAAGPAGGPMLALCGWVLFVVGGSGVQKFSEHWQDATPVAQRGLPAAAFDALLGGAAAGSALVLAGIGLALPGLVLFLRRGGWPQIRRPILRAAACGAAALAATVALAEVKAAPLALLWVLLAAATLVTSTAAAVATARRLDLSPRVLRLEAQLAGAVTAAMAAMTAATAVWWAALALAAPAFLGSTVPPALLVAAVLMALATALGAAGTAHARTTRRSTSG